MHQKVRIRVAGVLSERGKVLLVCHEKEGERYRLLPGGGVEFGETLEAALKREFLEEVNLKIRVGKLILIHETIAPNGSRHVLNLTFLVRKISGKLKVKTDHRLRGAAFVPWGQLRSVKLRPEIGEELLAAHRKKFRRTPRLIGNRWT